MNKLVQSCAVILSVAALCSATVWADELASAEKQILKQWRKHRSMRAKLTQTEATEAKGNKASQRGEGTYEFMRKGDAILFRRLIESTMEVEAGGQKMSFKSTTLTVCDGKYVYTLSERVGLKTAIKAKLAPQAEADVRAFFENLRAESNLKLLAEQAVDGQNAYVVEATPKSKRSGRPYRTMVYYFSKDHGVLLKQESRDQDGKVVQTTSYTDLEFDAKIDPKRFKFEVPKGVTVQDMTGD